MKIAQPEKAHGGKVDDVSVSLGRREQAKTERRSRIVTAAHNLISESGIDAMSMKRVAERAEVSLSTVYNLFDSKEAMLALVFNGVFDEYRRVVIVRGSDDPLQMFFDAVDIAAEFYISDVPFYKSLVWMVGLNSSLKLEIRQPRHQFYCDLVEDAIGRGLLKPTADARIIGMTIVPLYSFAYQMWAAEAISIDEFCIRAKFGMLVVLKAFIVPEALARVDAHIHALEAWMQAQFTMGRKRGGLSKRLRSDTVTAVN
jgi:AcrR family transcriptional regulator